MSKKREKSNAPMSDRMSAFGGVRLEAAGGFEEPVMAGLAEVGFDDAEQLVAVAAIDGMKEHLAEHLGISRQQVEALVDHAGEVIEPQVLRSVDHPDTQVHGLGALEPTPEMKARAEALMPEIEGLEAVTIPAAISLIPRMSPIRDQAQRGTCVAFAVTAMNEYMRNAAVTRTDLSEQHLYYETKLIDGSPTQCGTMQLYAARALATRGQCREVTWPYNPGPPCNNHGPLPPNARSEGLRYRLQIQQLPSRNVSMIKSALASRRPVGVSIPVYDSWYKSVATAQTGRITMRLGTEPAVGGHAICLVGYQDQEAAPGGGYFILRNSWGTRWARSSPYGPGYGTIPYGYIAADNWEAFTPSPAPTSAEDEAEDEEPEDGQEPKPKARTITIKVKGDVNLIIT